MTDLATAKHLLGRRKTPDNTGLANWQIHRVGWLIKVWFASSIRQPADGENRHLRQARNR